MSQPWTGPATPRVLADAHFAAAADRLGCDVATIRAVWEVEAGGRHFLPDGSVIRRFEPHHFPREHWSALGFVPRPGEAAWRASVRLSSESMFQRAWRLDRRAALRAASWGAPQIMGFNASAAGFATAEDMVRHMARGADHQLGAFVQLIEGWGIAGALRARDWQAFAARYNGSGQVAEYARRMESAYRRHAGGQRSAVVLRVGDRGPAVAELQRALRIAEDGAFGPGTLRAVMAFQERAGIAVDGIVGARTWDSLRQAHPEDPPRPPAQDTSLDARSDLAGQVSGGVAGVSAFAVAVGQLREALPEDTFQIAIWVGLAAAAIWLAPRLLRRWRRAW